MERKDIDDNGKLDRMPAPDIAGSTVTSYEYASANCVPKVELVKESSSSHSSSVFDESNYLNMSGIKEAKRRFTSAKHMIESELMALRKVVKDIEPKQSSPRGNTDESASLYQIRKLEASLQSTKG